MYTPKSYVRAIQQRWNERLAELPDQQAANVRFMAWLALLLLVLVLGVAGIAATIEFL